MTETEIDWEQLRQAAHAATDRSYAPYSKFRVGAAALVDDGRLITGCNVENASYGLSLCAECGLISQLHDTGGGRLLAVTAMHADGTILAPCGRCRQLLLEAGGGELRVDGADRPRPLAELLPDSFSVDDLEERGPA
jgi:cytidine deaminase